MAKLFNTTGYCDPQLHYMVDLSGRLAEIRKMVDAGAYFSINKARQYGKTTILMALADYMEKDYVVISLDFQAFTTADFESEQNFTVSLSRELLDCMDSIPYMIREKLEQFSTKTACGDTLSALFKVLTELCRKSEKKVVLIIDEVDSASNNQVFIDFLALLRFYYLKRKHTHFFQSVILAGVYDVRNVKRKIRSDHEHKQNSPWNIAEKFRVDMDFSREDIAGMLGEYERDYHTGMDIYRMSALLFDYTSGYPYLVSSLCKTIDEEVVGTREFSDRKAAWTKDGFLVALKIVLNETNPLFQSLTGKLQDYPNLRTVLYDLLFTGKQVPYTAMNEYIEIATMLGFVKNLNGTTVISNIIFETLLYNLFMSEEYTNSRVYNAGLQGKNQFVMDGHLNVRLILEKFVETFDYLYGDKNETFLEDAGRKYFLLFLKPIINGTGNCYVEPETRNHERMDLVIDYGGEQFVIEMNVWHGNAYNERGEEQLSAYLDYFHLRRGYMLSFNFNKKKEVGVKEVVLDNKVLIEAVV